MTKYKTLLQFDMLGRAVRLKAMGPTFATRKNFQSLHFAPIIGTESRLTTNDTLGFNKDSKFFEGFQLIKVECSFMKDSYWTLGGTVIKGS